MAQRKTKSKSKPTARYVRVKAVERRISERYFNGLPVVDAKENLRVYVTAQDIRKASPKDPTNCVYAQACRRLFGSTTIVFLRTKAYVDLADEKGKRAVHRFHVHRFTREQIIRFDQLGEASEGGFLLSAPTHTQRLNWQRDYQRERRERIKELGDDYKVTKRPAMIKGNVLVTADLTEVRDGRGMVQFRPELEDEVA